MNARLISPPAKVVRSVLFGLCEMSLPTMISHQGMDELAGVGLTIDVPVSPLETVAAARVKAAQPDDAEVDVSAWALPDETTEVAAARQVLRRFAVRWWYHYQRKVAEAWLAEEKRTRADHEAVHDALRRMRAATYFTWPRGSRHLFYKVKDPGWSRDLRDGVAFWRVGHPPTGRMPNARAPSRAAELLAREKVFKLIFNGYLERGHAKLYTPRFLVPKVVENGEVLDVRCVWDSKVNGFNQTLWSPGFMLPTSRDAEELVVRWLDVPVGIYLKAGSPQVSYTQPGSHYIKSKQGDIDVGQHFSNFMANERDRPYLGVRHIATNNAPGEKERHESFVSNRLTFG